MLKESFRMSLQNIWNNKLRSFLTMLGIIIGVTAVIALITIVSGMTDEVTSQFTQLGAGKVSIRANGTALKAGLTETDMQRLAAIDNVAGVSPSLSFTQPTAAGGKLFEKVTVEGRSDLYFRNGPELMGRGRPLTALDMDPHSRVCVINQDAAKEMFLSQDPVGKTVTIAGHSYTVVGVLAQADDTDVMAAMSKMYGSDNAIKLIIPYQAALRMMDSSHIASLELYLKDTDKADETLDAVEAVLNQAFNYKDDAFTVINLDSLLDTMNTMISMMTTMLAGIASIALLVGGIGIMNMMLVSVTERTTEIGLRKALGAKPGSIQVQFLMESIIMSLLGGLLGVLLGNLISYAAAYVIGYAFAVSPSATALGFFFSAFVGVFFGWAPARKASRLNPIDALRSM